MHPAAPDQAGAVFPDDERTVRQGAKPGLPALLAAGADIHAFTMHLCIDVPRTRRRIERLRGLPGVLPGSKGAVPAFAAGPVAGSDGGGFVEEEQFRIAPWRHDVTMPSAKFQPADQPGLQRPAPRAELPVFVMQDAAIAHEAAAFGNGDDIAQRRDAVLQRHGSGGEGGLQEGAAMLQPRHVDAMAQSGARQCGDGEVRRR